MTQHPDDVYVTALQVDEIFADHTYQRPVDQPRARKMAREWERRLAGILEVSDRGENVTPRYAVIDGQHRWAAAKFLKDPPQLVANVHSGLSIADEATLFDKLNRQRKQPGVWDHWKARRAAGDERVLAIEALIVKHNLEMNPAPKDGCVGCISTLERVEKISIDLLDETLGFIASVWQARRDGLDAPIVHGVALVLHRLREQLDHQRLVDALSDVLPRQIKTQAVALRDMQPGTLPVLTAVVIMGLYNKRPGRRIEVTNKTFGGSGVVNTPRAARERREASPNPTRLKTVAHTTEHRHKLPDALPPQHPETDTHADAVMAMDGQPVADIAKQLGISERTVRRIRADLGLSEAS